MHGYAQHIYSKSNYYSVIAKMLFLISETISSDLPNKFTSSCMNHPYDINLCIRYDIALLTADHKKAMQVGNAKN